MKHIAILVLCAAILLAASCRVIEKQAGGEAPGEQTYLLRLKPLEKTLSFRLERKVAIEPAIERHGPFSYTLEYEIQPTGGLNTEWHLLKLVPAATVPETLAAFKGLQSKLGQFKLAQVFDEQGPATRPTPQNMMAEGWAAHELAAALGAMDFGFTGIRLPDRALRLGESWSGEFSRAAAIEQEFKARNLLGLKVAPGKEDIRFTLAVVQGSLAQVDYAVNSVLTITFEGTGGTASVNDTLNEIGSVWLDLDSGWPVRASSTRSHWRDEKLPVTETLTTTIERVSP